MSVGLSLKSYVKEGGKAGFFICKNDFFLFRRSSGLSALFSVHSPKVELTWEFFRKLRQGLLSVQAQRALYLSRERDCWTLDGLMSCRGPVWRGWPRRVDSLWRVDSLCRGSWGAPPCPLWSHSLPQGPLALGPVNPTPQVVAWLPSPRVRPPRRPLSRAVLVRWGLSADCRSVGGSPARPGGFALGGGAGGGRVLGRFMSSTESGRLWRSINEQFFGKGSVLGCRWSSLSHVFLRRICCVSTYPRKHPLLTLFKSNLCWDIAAKAPSAGLTAAHAGPGEPAPAAERPGPAVSFRGKPGSSKVLILS